METKLKNLRAVMFMLLLMLCAGSVFARRILPCRVAMDAAMDKPVMLADKKQTAYLRIALTGFEMPAHHERAPVNVAIVIDKSGSMRGEKIAKAREAAIMAIERLNSNDIISVVTYDSDVEVLIPATKVSDKESIIHKIRHIRAGGSTALYGGVKKGAKEIRKFICSYRVSRLILLSDGLANVGPQSPAELGRLGESLIEDGISATTIGLGLGYNEDLMTQLAYKSDGSHYFAEEAGDLAKVFDRELGRALSVVAQEIQVEITCSPGVRPVRLLGRDGEIKGRNVCVFINQLYSGHEKYILLEVEVGAVAAKKTRKIASVNVRYDNLQTHDSDKLSTELSATFSSSKQLVDKKTNHKVMVDVVEQIATERNELAVTLRDQGKIDKAREVLGDNAGYLNSNAAKYNSKKLKDFGMQNEADAMNLDEQNWTRQRKSMRYEQSSRKRQQ